MFIVLEFIILINTVWPNEKLVYPDFMRNSTHEWWKLTIQNFITNETHGAPVDGIWIVINKIKLFFKEKIIKKK